MTRAAKSVLLALFGRRAISKLRLLLRGLAYRDILGFLDIDGWLTTDEAIALYDAARSLPEERPVAVEVGSWLGRSSLVIAKGLRRKRSPVLYCIDPFNAEGDPLSRDRYRALSARMEVPLRDVFVQNMQAHGVLNTIRVLQGYSHEFAGSFSEPIDLLFLDGNHDYSHVLRDCCDWAPRVKPGGILAFHDTTRPGPWKVIGEKVIECPLWCERRVVGNLFVTRRSLG